MKNMEIVDLKSCIVKEYFEVFCYFGWCIWEYYYDDINEFKVINDMKMIEVFGIFIWYVLIDDGYFVYKNR